MGNYLGIMYHMDNLTKLQTIGYVRDQWQAFSGSVPIVDTLLYFDIDTLICFNDIFGMEESDRKLSFVACKIRESIPEKYPVVRFAGEEFMALINEIDFPEEKLLKLLKELNDPNYKIKVSYSNIDHFSVSCCMMKIGALSSFEQLGVLTDKAIEAIRKKKSPTNFRKYKYQGVLAVENAA